MYYNTCESKMIPVSLYYAFFCRLHRLDASNLYSKRLPIREETTNSRVGAKAISISNGCTNLVYNVPSNFGLML